MPCKLAIIGTTAMAVGITPPVISDASATLAVDVFRGNVVTQAIDASVLTTLLALSLIHI